MIRKEEVAAAHPPDPPGVCAATRAEGQHPLASPKGRIPSEPRPKSVARVAETDPAESGPAPGPSESATRVGRPSLPSESGQHPTAVWPGRLRARP